MKINSAKSKKAQLTLFIIMGIIILLGAVFFLYIYGEIKPNPGTEEIAAEVPDWAKPVNEYVQNCIQEIAVKGFKKMGEHGGYIDMDDIYLSEKTFKFDDDLTESDAVMFSRSSFSPIPYWWYLSSQNRCSDCYMGALIPTLEEMAGQMDRYINRELPTCLNGFSPFRQQNMEIGYSSVNTTTTVNRDDVDIAVNFPLKIKTGDKEASIKEFKLTLDLALVDAYALAIEVIADEINSQTFEDITMFLINSYAQTPSADKIPPISWIDNKKSTVSWDLSSVKQKIREYILAGNIGLLQVDKTRNAKRIAAGGKIQQGVYDVLYLEILNTSYQNHEVSFLYDPRWDLYLDIRPKPLVPVSVKSDFPMGLAPSIQTNYYEFFYDISYPIVMVINDGRSLTKYGEKGYKFMVALEVNIRGNKNLLQFNQGEGVFGPYDYSGVSASMERLSNEIANCTGSEPGWTCSFNSSKTYESESACKSICYGSCEKIFAKWTCPLDSQEYNSEITCIQNCKKESKTKEQSEITQSLFCDNEQKISKEITINIQSAQTKQNLEHVSIAFSCGNYRSCPMGQTNINGTYKDRFPLCIGDGTLTLEKEGYLAKAVPHVAIGLDEPKTINVQLEPLTQKTAEAVYINVTNLFRINRYMNNVLPKIESQITILQNAISSAADLSSGEMALVMREITNSKNNIAIAKSLTQNKTYWSEIKREDVVRAVNLVNDAVQKSNMIIEGPDYISSLIEREWTGAITIPQSTYSILQEFSSEFSKIASNIQFLEASELYNPPKISLYRADALPLKGNEQAIISLEKIKESQYDKNAPTPQTIIKGNETTQINLVPGKYQVNIQFMDTDGLNVPNPPGQDIDYTPALLGGAALSNITGYWIIDENDLSKGDKIRFYFFRVDAPENLEDLNEIGKIEEYSKRYRAYIEPEFLS
ncbi:MAG: hypothetical protein ABIH64_03940 [Nanoarchaeota archaeon]